MGILEFTELAERAESESGCELYDIYSDGLSNPSSFEDDGILHVVIGMNRAAFDVSENQALSAEKQNANTRKVMEIFGLDVTERVLA